MSLPTELIIQISHYLSVNDKRTGLLVCHDWYEAFRLGLYHEIRIKNIKQLHLLLYSLNNNTHPIPHGQLVKRLYINKQPDQKMTKTEEGMVLCQDLFKQLPLLCPYLEVLDFDPASWNCIGYIPEMKNTWSRSMRQLPTLSHLGAVLPFLTNIGKHLTHMSISSGMTLGDDDEDGLDSLLESVPNLTHLEIKPLDTHLHPFIITLEDMETIHRLVSSLKSLKITGNNIQIPAIDLETVDLDALIPFESIETLHIHIPQLDTTWLLYVSQKYPHVKDLVLNLYYSIDPRYDYSILYTSLLSKCNYIQYLQLGAPDICHWLNPSVLNTIVERSCIRELAPLKGEDQIKTDQELKTAAEYGRNVLTALYIEQWRLDTKMRDTVRLLYAFSKLTHLEFRCDSYNDEYRLVDILDSCANLKHLSLEWGTVTTPLEEYIYRNYPLESIAMTYVAFGDTFFSQFLSNHCPSLNQISLSKCKQLCVMNNVKTQTLIEINMPHHHLTNVSIHNVRLEYSSASLFYHNATNYIRILELKEKDTVWYHHVGYSNRRHPLMNTLDRVDQMAIHHYLSNPSLIQLSQQKWGDALKTDLMFGHITLECQSIQHLFLDGNAHGS
jgi:hypothetical protein